MLIPAADKARVALIVAFATMLAPHTLTAQSSGTAVVANIPFAFQVGSNHMPAGTYKIELQGDDLLWIKGDSGSSVMMVTRQSPNKSPSDSAVVFHHYGNQYFLREVRNAGEAEVMWSTETKAERRAKLEEDASNPNSGPRGDSKVEVALLTPPR